MRMAYWLTPNRIARYSFEKLCHFNQNSEIDFCNYDFNVLIKNEHSRPTPHLLTVATWKLNITGKMACEIITTFKLINDSRTPINEKLITRVVEKNVEISTPFNDLNLLGNDLSYVALAGENALTLRCSSFLQTS